MHILILNKYCLFFFQEHAVISHQDILNDLNHNLVRRTPTTLSMLTKTRAAKNEPIGQGNIHRTGSLMISVHFFTVFSFINVKLRSKVGLSTSHGTGSARQSTNLNSRRKKKASTIDCWSLLCRIQRNGISSNVKR